MKQSYPTHPCMEFGHNILNNYSFSCIQIWYLVMKWVNFTNFQCWITHGIYTHSIILILMPIFTPDVHEEIIVLNG